MGSVFVSMTVTLDGYAAPADSDQERWGELMSWVHDQKFFRENLKIGEGGQTGPDNTYLEKTFERTGTTIIGKRMFDAGEQGWPEEAPFHTPVFVLTHQVRKPWERPGGTTFHFVNDGIESALKQARRVAGKKDVRIGGGADTVIQYLNAGLVDTLELAVAPVVFGRGTRLFDRVDGAKIGLEATASSASPRVTHLRYTVRPK
jgi:dihydrofolate reductase